MQTLITLNWIEWWLRVRNQSIESSFSVIYSARTIYFECLDEKKRRRWEKRKSTHPKHSLGIDYDYSVYICGKGNRVHERRVLARNSTWFFSLSLCFVDVLCVANDVWTTLYSYTHTLEHCSKSKRVNSEVLCSMNTIQCNNKREKKRKWHWTYDVMSTMSRTI
jgi:hypothetical protein